MAWEPNPLRLEDTDPVLSALLMDIANGIHPDIKTVDFSSSGTILGMRNGSIRVVKEIGPNEPCYCRSGKKYKKCCKNITVKKDHPLMCKHCHKEVKVIKDKNDTTTCRCYDPKG